MIRELFNDSKQFAAGKPKSKIWFLIRLQVHLTKVKPSLTVKVCEFAFVFFCFFDFKQTNPSQNWEDLILVWKLRFEVAITILIHGKFTL